MSNFIQQVCDNVKTETQLYLATMMIRNYPLCQFFFNLEEGMGNELCHEGGSGHRGQREKNGSIDCALHISQAHGGGH